MSRTFLQTYNLALEKTAILQNAYNIREEQELNKIYSLSFSIPATDPKADFIQPFHYIRYGDKGELYRIIKSELNDSDTSILTVSCEHVIATLCDTVMFGAIQYGGTGIRTREVIEYLLSRQPERNWILHECDFDRRFEYLWEEENLLNALYSIPKEFSQTYKWTFDTTVYPWRISLKVIDETIDPEYYIRARRNLLSSGTSQNFTDICTRIYPLGYGEGVNQLTIKEVNNGVPYLQSPDNIVAQYGIKEKVLVDRRFEIAENLKTYAQTMLDNLQTPSMSRSFNVVDLYPITGAEIDNAKVGNICKMTMDDTISYVTKTIRALDEAGNLQIQLSSKTTDVADTIADLAERVRIESVYAQGATQLYQHSKDANASPNNGMILNLYFPTEMRQINKVLIRVQVKPFRSYSSTTSDAGGSERTTSDGGGTTATSTSGGGTGSTSTSAASVSGSVTSEASSIVTTESGGTGTDIVTSKTALEGNTGYAEPSVGESSAVSGTTDPATFDIKNSSTQYSDKKTTDNGTATVSISGNTGNSSPSTSSAGAHTHNVWGYTGEVTPPASANYKHSHAINYSNAALSAGSHSHSVNSHSHSFSGSGSSSHNHGMYHYHGLNLSGVGSHSHTFSVPAHTHTMSKHRHMFTHDGHSHTIGKQLFSHTHGMSHTHIVSFSGVGSHSHTFSVPAHTHDVNIPSHSHNVTIPAHNHNIIAGIFESSEKPTEIGVYVGGTKRTRLVSSTHENLIGLTWNLDAVQWLLNTNGEIPRGSWITLNFVPDKLCYIICSVFVQGFVQSRGGGNY